MEWVVYYTMFACALEGSAGFGLKVRPTAARKTDKSKNILRPLCVGFKLRRKKQLCALSSANSRVGVGGGHEGLCIRVCVCVGHFVNQRAITRTVVCKCIKFIFHLLSCIKQPQSKFRVRRQRKKA